MAFGLAGAPATFSTVMDAVLMGLRDVKYLGSYRIIGLIVFLHVACNCGHCVYIC